MSGDWTELLAEEWRGWHLDTFPDSTPGAYALKAAKEAQEFSENPSLEEAADVVLCIWGWLDLLGYSHGDLLESIDMKIAKNQARTWERLPDGTYQHIG